MSAPDLPPAVAVVQGGAAIATLRLSYEERLVRRKRLATLEGPMVLVDLPQVASLNHGDRLRLADGRLVAVEAAAEPLMDIRGDLPRLAWHIGNRHAPCQIETDRLLIRRDVVLEKMLAGLGARVTHLMAPFTPEGGAYGHGRTFGHDHAH
ncbi:MAG: urease accessory protein UreE [Limimaricola sp.]|uniref:urease accessory protein UreE n=1 Tax=Limimaricola sp. TaxID=2211665 RepID=UPI001D756DAB|nr:urease accessory protein UreE [Limimaricola sp.]MBI1415820.1 urease accessory protein UreE [Limimaricola sp.]